MALATQYLKALARHCLRPLEMRYSWVLGMGCLEASLDGEFVDVCPSSWDWVRLEVEKVDGGNDEGAVRLEAYMDSLENNMSLLFKTGIGLETYLKTLASYRPEIHSTFLLFVVVTVPKGWSRIKRKQVDKYLKKILNSRSIIIYL